MIKTPVAFFVFNRPQHTAQSFNVIRSQKPASLFIIADGPRDGYPADVQKCAEVRSLVEQIDWPCEVHRNYADSNIGLKNRVSSGLNWVFKQAERAIILEDDCVPHPDFFSFCDALLELYADDERISVITGNNFQGGQRRGDGSYYFSKYNHCWGWATWRRAWLNYDGDISFWPEFEESIKWTDIVPDPVERKYWKAIFDRVHRNEVNSWAYPWTASVWYKSGLTVTPNVNLVSNIGMDSEATHTTSEQSDLSNISTHPLGEIKHPIIIKLDEKADKFVFDNIYGGLYLRWPRNWLNYLHRIANWVYKKIKW
jgi:hypothetical protein